MVTTDTITRFHMVFFEDHLAGCLNGGGMDSRCSACGFGDLAGSTEKMVTCGAGNVVGAREKGAIMKENQVICGGRGQRTTLAGDILDGGKPSMREAVVPKKKLLLCQ